MGDAAQPPYLTIRSVSSGDRQSLTSTDSAYASAPSDFAVPSTTHDIGRVNYHVKHLDSFARTLEDSAGRAFPNRGRSQQRYTKVKALLLHWKSDDLFVLPELEDLEKCMREDYGFDTDTFSIPSDNAHIDLMMRVGSLIKDFEAPNTLFIVYYGGHARIDESRQSTWCATRSPNSPWLQWSAIQTLLERSVSDTLILLDCCAGAASATFPNGKSITETISASSWDAIAPDPGRYSFTSALIEVLQEWRLRTFSAAMLHAEILARLKHPRPITINGKLFEARSTPVHFMMTANHRAPSIEIGRILPKNRQLPSPPADTEYDQHAAGPSTGRGPLGQAVNDPNEDEPHVMISLALEDDQNLDLNAWEQWLGSFPALAKYVKVQGVFKSHSTLLLLSVPVMVWDLLPENRACSFVAFIRSNNLIKETRQVAPEGVPDAQSAPVRNTEPSQPLFAGDVGQEIGSGSGEALVNVDVNSDEDYDYDGGDSGHEVVDFSDEDVDDIINIGRRDSRLDDDAVSVISGTTFTPTDGQDRSTRMSIASTAVVHGLDDVAFQRLPVPQRTQRAMGYGSGERPVFRDMFADKPGSSPASALIARPRPGGGSQRAMSQGMGVPGHGYVAEQGNSFFKSIASSSRTMMMNQQRVAKRTNYEANAPESPKLSQHIVGRLEEYFQAHPNPSVGIAEFFASNLGVEKRDIDQWFHRRRQQERTTKNLQSLIMTEYQAAEQGDANGANMILPGQLNRLLDIFPPNTVLCIDLRSPTYFEKSHIYGAVNLRTPVSFVEHLFDLIDGAFTDGQSRRDFARAPSSRCIVFYDRVVEYPWECPMADALVSQLRRKHGWNGDHYVLKGHYREFSASFDKYITGDRITQAAKDYSDSLRQRSPPTLVEREAIEDNYSEWKDLVELENRKPQPVPGSQATLEERQQAVQQHQAELETELEMRSPALYRKLMGFGPPPLHKSYSTADMYDTRKGGGYDSQYYEKELRTDLVGPLSRGLEKMQEGSSTFNKSLSYDKLGEIEGAAAQPVPLDEDYDDIDPRDEQLRDDALFLKAGDLGDGAGGAAGIGRGRGPGANDPRRGREKPFWKRLRTTK